MKRPFCHKIGEKGEELIISMFEEGTWVARKLGKDYAIDIEVELDQPEVLGKYLKLQVKTTQSLSFKDDVLPVRVKKSFLRYAMECRLPVILIQVGMDKKEAFWIWVQDYVARKNLESKLETSGEKMTVNIPRANEITQSRDTELRKIAQGATVEQLSFALADTALRALAVKNLSVAALSVQAIEDLHAPYLSRAVEMIPAITSSSIALGNLLRGIPEGNQVTEILYILAQMAPTAFSSGNIRKLVIRPEQSYSRVELNVIAIINWKAPNHLKNLNLPTILGKDRPGLSYFLQILLRNLGKNPFEIVSQDSLKGTEFYVSKNNRERLFDKLMNRGISAILDFAEPL